MARELLKKVEREQVESLNTPKSHSTAKAHDSGHQQKKSSKVPQAPAMHIDEKSSSKKVANLELMMREILNGQHVDGGDQQPEKVPKSAHAPGRHHSLQVSTA